MINANIANRPARAQPSGQMEPARVANVKRAEPVLQDGRRMESPSYRYTSDRQCPLCRGQLIRTPRRLQDRLWSVVEPMMRFRCDRFSCQWVGNIKGRDPGARRGQSQGPWLKATLITTLLACAGVAIFAMVFARDAFDSAPTRMDGAASAEWQDLTYRLDSQSIGSPAPNPTATARPYGGSR